MPQKLKLSKAQLKKEKDALKMFNRYLPMLILKKQQLQAEINKISAAIEEVQGKIKAIEQSVEAWVDVFAENIDIASLIRLESIETRQGNIAGVDIPVFVSARIVKKEYDLLHYPLWVDYALETLEKILALRAQIKILLRQQEVLRNELRITAQRVNLFEKVMIPQTKNNIRIINIYLGDLQTASVVRGKLAKSKIEARERGLLA
jgi:V/A-type H+-transporting ATPase subunit D